MTMTTLILLSDRLRSNVECAPWVIAAVKELEACYQAALEGRDEAVRDRDNNAQKYTAHLDRLRFEHDARNNAVLSDLRKLVSRTSGGDCEQAHGLDCTTILSYRFDQLRAENVRLKDALRDAQASALFAAEHKFVTVEF
jgi:acetyl esterase/lipase